MKSSQQAVRTVLWEWTNKPGLERFELLRAPDRWVLRGMILTKGIFGPAEARYEVLCDGSWQARWADISLRDDAGEHQLRITVEQGRWHENGVLNESVAGCVDIDLGWTPSTNTLPIRRLRLELGQSSGPLTAAWVRFPELKLQPLPQECLRTSQDKYRYSSRGGSFVADLSVDDEGVVVEYERFWKRVSTTA